MLDKLAKILSIGLFIPMLKWISFAMTWLPPEAANGEGVQVYIGVNAFSYFD